MGVAIASDADGSFTPAVERVGLDAFDGLCIDGLCSEVEALRCEALEAASWFSEVKAEGAAPAAFCIGVALGAAACWPAAELFAFMLGLFAATRVASIGLLALTCDPVILAAGCSVTRREGDLRAT